MGGLGAAGRKGGCGLAEARIRGWKMRSSERETQVTTILGFSVIHGTERQRLREGIQHHLLGFAEAGCGQWLRSAMIPSSAHLVGSRAPQPISVAGSSTRRPPVKTARSSALPGSCNKDRGRSRLQPTQRAQFLMSRFRGEYLAMRQHIARHRIFVRCSCRVHEQAARRQAAAQSRTFSVHAAKRVNRQWSPRSPRACLLR
ncbi:hypothetical protein SAMN05444279_11066 [Ruegeria intermedia]|uniref:Uncharacterized protein n=1 Tax=Ruegeria intermedia TaxID=996115 RepID=A0A1M4X0T6_9RHOB|nr:hypothetical protein SAMN05444279_11066 [Ruegeria intermedia]